MAILETDRLRLRRFAPGDVSRLAQYRSDPRVARYQGWDIPFSEDDAQAFVAEMVQREPFVPHRRWVQLAVECRREPGLLGDVAVRTHEDDHTPRSAQLGYTFAPAAQGQGYATEIVRATVDHLFRICAVHRVYAHVDVRNAPSIGLLERLRFRREATFLEHERWWGELMSEHVYALLSREC